MGFQVAPGWVECPLHALWPAVMSFETTRTALGFGTDGAVIKINSQEVQGLLGDGSRAPKWAVAYKFTAEEGETDLLDITVQVGVVVSSYVPFHEFSLTNDITNECCHRYHPHQHHSHHITISSPLLPSPSSHHPHHHITLIITSLSSLAGWAHRATHPGGSDPPRQHRRSDGGASHAA